MAELKMINSTAAPEIAVIVPVHNTEKYIGECLHSIQSQTFANFICVVVNDGSTDSSGNIAHSIADKDKRFVVFDRTNGGVSAARNFALDYLSQMNDPVKYVCFVDSDDVVGPDFVHDFVSQMEAHQADYAECGISAWYADGFKNAKPFAELSNECIKHDDIALHLFASGRFKDGDATIYRGLCNKCIRLDKIGNVRFDQSLNFCEDLNFILTLYPKLGSEVLIRKVSYLYRMRGSSATGKDEFMVERIQSDIKVYRRILDLSEDVNFKSILASALLNQLYCTWRDSPTNSPENTAWLFAVLKENYIVYGKLCTKVVKRKLRKIRLGYRFNKYYLHLRLKSSERRHKRKHIKRLEHAKFD